MCSEFTDAPKLTIQRSKLARPVVCAVGPAALDRQDHCQGRPRPRIAAGAVNAATAAAEVAGAAAEARLKEPCSAHTCAGGITRPVLQQLLLRQLLAELR